MGTEAESESRRQRAQPPRRCVHRAGVGLLLAAFAATPYPARAASLGVVANLIETSSTDEGNPSSLLSEEAGLLETLTIETGPTLAGRILRLGMRDDPFAGEQLLTLAAHSLVEKDPALRLRMALALSQRVEMFREKEMIRALIRIYLTAHHGEARAPSDPNDSALRANATLALSLARSADPEALRVLVSQAAATDRSLSATRTAIAALRAYPPSPELLTRLGPLIAPSVIERAMRAAREIVEDEPESKEPVELTPAMLIAAARAGLLAERLSWVGHRRHLRRDFFSRSAWREALSRDPAMGLRTLTIVAKTTEPSLVSFAKRMAHASLRSKKAAERSAAVWSLFVLDDQSALSLYQKGDELVRSALLQQLSENSCMRARQLIVLRDPSQPSAPEAILLERCALPPEHIATSALWRLPASSYLAMVFQLAARFTEKENGTRAPGVFSVRKWLTSEDPKTRASAARGLGFADSASARGLLAQAYLDEDHVAVRRTIVRSLMRLGLDSPRLLSWIVRYDPDPSCRALARGLDDPRGSGFVLRQGASGVVKVLSRHGIEYSGSASPDGIFAIVADDF